ncbi:leucine-rich repeat domain-containing protein [Hymenobacter caeli]|uniref:Leucine-rich repeat (LRR) protein n=1 Tax=Hymenobacter caeli TaxID=2735894 RepID=A0ABX2FK70_9BACT|nr:leucine-rich repeat domain-containing protein [Hymenobacter caeli]NRT17515.1 Leucine-rich repeat (LRR) protein [Hymenobacter caeli]
MRKHTTRYLRSADVVGGTELDTGRFEVAQYTYFSDVPHVTDNWYRQEVFVKARQLEALPVGAELTVPNALFTVQSYGQATWYFEQFQAIGGKLTRLPAPPTVLRLRLDLHYTTDKQQVKTLVRRTLDFPLDPTYLQRTRRDYHGQYDDLRLALKEPGKVRTLDLATWAIDYQKRNGQESGPDTLYRHLGKLYNLEELTLRYSNLQALPPKLNKLKRLKKLDLSYNHLADFPTGLSELDSLRELNLEWNRLDSIPPAIARLRSLRVLNLNDNHLVRYPEAVNELGGLDSLYLGNANLRRLPAGIGRLRQLQTLELNGFWNSKRRNQLTDLDALEALPLLRRLSLQDNALKKLPAAIYKLPKLEELNLRYNGLDSAAVEVRRLPKIRKLEL